MLISFAVAAKLICAFGFTYSEIKFSHDADQIIYRNDPKFSYILIWANSADPDQTSPRGAV